MELTYFNPNGQREGDFLSGFVARGSTLAFLLHQLRLVRPLHPPRHHLIVAPRGFGKTTLLRRIAISVRTDSEFFTRLIALRFREEQHNVISLDIFWRNCLQSLLEARENERALRPELDQIEADWASLGPRQGLSREAQDGEPARLAFAGRCDRLGRRPILLIDNLDTLLGGLSEVHQWELRKRLQEEDGPIMIAAASRFPESTRELGAPFYDFFRTVSLDRLADDEVFRCLRNLASYRGDAGRAVLNLLNADPGRVAALNALAGGNPRTLTVLYGVLESHGSADMLSQLRLMLDSFTGWYQARTEELPMQARAVFDAVALNWDPITASALGQSTGLDTPSVSSQLSRLERLGYVEPVALSGRGKGRSGYQVAERFFNIWYLMRNGPRRARESVKFLASFLQSCYSAPERRTLARESLTNHKVDPAFAVALASGLRHGDLKQQLLVRAEARCEETGQTSDYEDVILALRTNSDRKASARAASGSEPPNTSERDDASAAQPSEMMGDGLSERVAVARTLIDGGLELGRKGESLPEVTAYDEVVARFGQESHPELQRHVARALSYKGMRLAQLGRFQEAIDAYDDLLARFRAVQEPRVQGWVASAVVNRADVLGDIGRFEEELVAYDEVLDRFKDVADSRTHTAIARALVNKGYRLGALDRVQEAISAYDDLIARFGETRKLALEVQVSYGMVSKGILLGRVGDLEAEVEAYSAFLERFGDSNERVFAEQIAEALVNKGIALCRLERATEGLAVYDAVIERFESSTEPALLEHVARAMFNKGARLGKLSRTEEALAAYDRIIQRFENPTEDVLLDAVSRSLFNRASLLEARGLIEQAVADYSQLVALGSPSVDSVVAERVARTLVRKGIALGELDRTSEELDTYDFLIARYATSTDAGVLAAVAHGMVHKGITVGKQGSPEEEISVYDDMYARFAESTEPSVTQHAAWALASKAETLLQLDRLDEAAAVVDTLTDRFGDSSDSALCAQVARAMLSKGRRLSDLGKVEEAILVYEELIANYGTSSDRALVERVARAFAYKAFALGGLGRTEEELAAYEEAISRIGTPSGPGMAELLASAIVNRGGTLGSLGRTADEIAAYDDAVARFGASTDNELIEIITRALLNRGSAHLQLGQVKEGESSYRLAIKCGGNTSAAYNGLGNVLLDYLGDIAGARAAYEAGLSLDGEDTTRAMLRGNLAFLLALHTNERDAARSLVQLALEGERNLSVAGRHLLAALPCDDPAADLAWRQLFEQVGCALTCEDPRLWTTHEDDLLRLLWYVVRNGEGVRFVEWMVTRKLDVQCAPLYHAMVTAVEGVDHLLRINPEVREPAQRLYASLARLLELFGGD